MELKQQAEEAQLKSNQSEAGIQTVDMKLATSFDASLTAVAPSVSSANLSLSAGVSQVPSNDKLLANVKLVKDEGLFPGASKNAKGTIAAALLIYAAFVLIFPLHMSLRDHQLFSSVVGAPMPLVFAFRMAYPNALYRFQTKTPGFWLLYVAFLVIVVLGLFVLLKSIFPNDWNPAYFVWVIPLTGLAAVSLYLRRMEKLRSLIVEQQQNH